MFKKEWADGLTRANRAQGDEIMNAYERWSRPDRERIAALMEQIGVQAEEVRDAQTRTSKAVMKANNLERKLADVQAELDTKQNEILKLQQQLDSLRQQQNAGNPDARANIEQLNGKLQEQTRMADALLSEVNRLIKVIDEADAAINQPDSVLKQAGSKKRVRRTGNGNSLRINRPPYAASDAMLNRVRQNLPDENTIKKVEDILGELFEIREELFDQEQINNLKNAVLSALENARVPWFPKWNTVLDNAVQTAIALVQGMNQNANVSTNSWYIRNGNLRKAVERKKYAQVAPPPNLNITSEATTQIVELKLAELFKNREDLFNQDKRSNLKTAVRSALENDANVIWDSNWNITLDDAVQTAIDLVQDRNDAKVSNNTWYKRNGPLKKAVAQRYAAASEKLKLSTKFQLPTAARAIDTGVDYSIGAEYGYGGRGSRRKGRGGGRRRRYAFADGGVDYSMGDLSLNE
jgi:hypothetical protein